MTDKKEEIIDKIFNKYSWNLQGKGEPHDVVSHNIDLSLAIREAIRQTKAKCKDKFGRLLLNSELNYQITKEIPANYEDNLPYHLELLIKRWKELLQKADEMFKEEEN